MLHFVLTTFFINFIIHSSKGVILKILFNNP